MYSKPKNAKGPIIQKVSPVTLALQLTSGERLMGDFKPEVSLWEILEHWEKEGKLIPSLNGLANEVPACVYLRKEIANEESLRKTTLVDLGLLNGKAAIRYISKPEGLTEQAHVGGVLAARPAISEPQTTPETVKAISEETLQSKLELPKQENVDHHKDDVEMEEAPARASQESVPANEMEADPVIQSDAKEEVDMEQITENVSVQTSVVSETRTIEPASNEYCDDGRTLNYLNDAGYLVYVRPKDTVPTAKSLEDESDDFFELTEDDIRKRMHELVHQRNLLEGAQFLTAHQRAEQEKERQQKVLQRYPFTMLRVQFSDGLILQMPLPTDSTISKAKTELLSFIAGNIKLNEFEIFTAPPKNVLDTSTPLHLLGLTPSSLVYISSHCEIKEEYCSSPSSFFAATQDAYNRISAHDDSKEGKSTESHPKRQARGAKTSEVASVPKWLKLSKK